MPLSKIDSDSLNSGVPTRAQLPAGSVLQVVANSYATQTSTTSGSPQPSGLSASITPSSASSKILVMIADPVRKGGTNITGMQFFVYRNGSNIFQPMTNFAYTNPSTADFSGLASFWYLDSPASLSAVTYALYFSVNNVGSGATAYTQIDGNNGYITLMEIAA